MTLHEATDSSPAAAKTSPAAAKTSPAAELASEGTTGVVTALTTAPSFGAPLEAHEALTLVTDVGIDGDRHAGKLRQVTIVCTGELADAARALGVESLDGVTTRRNIVVDAPALPREHGARFKIGDTELAVWRDCAPCNLMDEFFGDGARNALHERCGISATVVNGGVIRLGDAITS